MISWNTEPLEILHKLCVQTAFCLERAAGERIDTHMRSRVAQACALCAQGVTQGDGAATAWQ